MLVDLGIHERLELPNMFKLNKHVKFRAKKGYPDNVMYIRNLIIWHLRN